MVKRRSTRERSKFMSSPTQLQSIPLGDQVAKLKALAPEYNGVRLRPSDAAFDRLLEFQAALSGFPVPELTPDGDGGFDVEWEAHDRRVVFNCPEYAQQKTLLCWKFVDRYEGAEATPELLIEKLNELFVNVGAVALKLNDRLLPKPGNRNPADYH